MFRNETMPIPMRRKIGEDQHTWRGSRQRREPPLRTSFWSCTRRVSRLDRVDQLPQSGFCHIENGMTTRKSRKAAAWLLHSEYRSSPPCIRHGKSLMLGEIDRLAASSPGGKRLSAFCRAFVAWIRDVHLTLWGKT